MELLKPILELIQTYGALAFTLALAAVVFLMFSRTWTKARDTQSEAEQSRTNLRNTSDEAQRMINKRVTVLEASNGEQAKRIDALEAELATTKETLARARRRIVRLTRQLEALEGEKGALATERDQLRTDLNSASQRIRELEHQVLKLQSELNTEKEVRKTVEPIIKLLERTLPQTDKLNPAKVPPTDPAAAPDLWTGDHPDDPPSSSKLPGSEGLPRN